MISISVLSETLTKKIENNPIKVIALLLLFHIFVSVIFSLVAYSSIASSLHNGDGLWNFARDSTLYHKEAIHLVQLINESAWQEWWETYRYHYNVKLISLIYWVTGYSLPITFEIINSLMWVISVVAIYASSRVLFQNSYTTYILTALFFFQPSILMSSTQLLRDPLLMAGVSLLCYGWIDFIKNKISWKNILIIYSGFVLIFSMRSYLVDIVLIVLVLYFVWTLFRRKLNLISIFLILFPVLIIQYSYEHVYTMPPDGIKAIHLEIPVSSTHQNAVKNTNTNTNANANSNSDSNINIKPNTKSDTNINTNPSLLDLLASRAGQLRFGFYNVNEPSGSKIDADIVFNNFLDVLKYSPRAVQVGFLSPFPSHWIEKGKETGYIGRIISGVETIIWYVIIIGFLFLIIRNKSILEPLIPLLIIAAIIIVLLGFIVPNIGAIYRMRQSFLIPFFIFGVHGVEIMMHSVVARLRKN